MLTGKVLDEGEGGIEGTLRAMVRQLGEPVIRTAVAAAMREMGEQFVLGRTVEEAVKRGKPFTQKGYLYSYDMLGEAARTEADALRYLRAYADAIASLKRISKGEDTRRNPGISVKLSAIHPRYKSTQRETMLPVIAERLLGLCQAARDARMGLNIDAEEADRLELSLDVIERVLEDRSIEGWAGFGVVVQAYGPAPRMSSTGSTRWRKSSTGGSWFASSREPIGTRNQAGAGDGATRLPRLHAQGQYRRLLHRECPQAARHDRPHLSAVRDAQCAHHCRRARHDDRA